MFINGICTNYSILNALSIIFTIIDIVKIVVPLLIIVLGMIDYTKATTSSDEKALQKSTLALLRRLIAGVVVFFVPTIITAFISLLNNATGGNFTIEECIINTKDKTLFNKIKENYENAINEKKENIINIVSSSVKNVRNISSGSNVKETTLNYLNQGDYGGSFCGNGNTIKNSGCGAVSFAMIVKAFSDDYAKDSNSELVEKVRSWFCNNYYDLSSGGLSYKAITKAETMDKFSLQYEVIMDHLTAYTPYYEDDGKKILKTVQEGKAIMIAIPGHWSVIGQNSSCSEKQVYFYDVARSWYNGCYTPRDLYNIIYNYQSRCSNSGWCGWNYALAIWNK